MLDNTSKLPPHQHPKIDSRRSTSVQTESTSVTWNGDIFAPQLAPKCIQRYRAERSLPGARDGTETIFFYCQGPSLDHGGCDHLLMGGWLLFEHADGTAENSGRQHHVAQVNSDRHPVSCRCEDRVASCSWNTSAIVRFAGLRTESFTAGTRGSLFMYGCAADVRLVVELGCGISDSGCKAILSTTADGQDTGAGAPL